MTGTSIVFLFYFNLHRSCQQLVHTQSMLSTIVTIQWDVSIYIWALNDLDPYHFVYSVAFQFLLLPLCPINQGNCGGLLGYGSYLPNKITRSPTSPSSQHYWIATPIRQLYGSSSIFPLLYNPIIYHFHKS